MLIPVSEWTGAQRAVAMKTKSKNNRNGDCMAFHNVVKVVRVVEVRKTARKCDFG